MKPCLLHCLEVAALKNPDSGRFWKGLGKRLSQRPFLIEIKDCNFPKKDSITRVFK